jgi:hypothetical protein
MHKDVVMPFPFFNHKYEVQSNLLGPSLRTIIRKIESELNKENLKLTPPNIEMLFEKIEFDPETYVKNFYDKKAKVICETDLSKDWVDAINDLASLKVLKALPQDKHGVGIAADSFGLEKKSDSLSSGNESIDDEEEEEENDNNVSSCAFM